MRVVKDKLTVSLGILYAVLAATTCVMWIAIQQILPHYGSGWGGLIWVITTFPILVLILISLVLNLVFINSKTEGATSGQVGFWVGLPGWVYFLIAAILVYYPSYDLPDRIIFLITFGLLIALTACGVLLFSRTWKYRRMEKKKLPGVTSGILLLIGGALLISNYHYSYGIEFIFTLGLMAAGILTVVSGIRCCASKEAGGILGLIAGLMAVTLTGINLIINLTSSSYYRWWPDIWFWLALSGAILSLIGGVMMKRMAKDRVREAQISQRFEASGILLMIGGAPLIINLHYSYGIEMIFTLGLMTAGILAVVSGIRCCASKKAGGILGLIAGLMAVTLTGINLIINLIINLNTPLYGLWSDNMFGFVMSGAILSLIGGIMMRMAKDRVREASL